MSLALRRWPRETETPITASLPKEKWCHGMTSCLPLLAVESRLRVKGAELQQSVTDGMQEAEFTRDLPAGDTTIEGWFMDKDQQSWSACYLYAQKLQTAK